MFRTVQVLWLLFMFELKGGFKYNAKRLEEEINCWRVFTVCLSANNSKWTEMDMVVDPST